MERQDTLKEAMLKYGWISPSVLSPGIAASVRITYESLWPPPIDYMLFQGQFRFWFILVSFSLSPPHTYTSSCSVCGVGMQEIFGGRKRKGKRGEEPRQCLEWFWKRKDHMAWRMTTSQRKLDKWPSHQDVVSPFYSEAASYCSAAHTTFLWEPLKWWRT